MISVDFFQDLLNVLKSISQQQLEHYMSGGPEHGEAGKVKSFKDARSAFHSIVASFQLLSGQGEALNVDLKDFCTTFYTQMMRLPCMPPYQHTKSFDEVQDDEDAKKEEMKILQHSHRKNAIELTLQGMNLVFCKRKEERKTCYIFFKTLLY